MATYPLADGVVLDGQLITLGPALSQQILNTRQLLLQDAVFLLEGQQRGHGPRDGRCGMGTGLRAAPESSGMGIRPPGWSQDALCSQELLCSFSREGGWAEPSPRAQPRPQKAFFPPQPQMLWPRATPRCCVMQFAAAKLLQICICNCKTRANLCLNWQNRCRVEVVITRQLEIYRCDRKNTADLSPQSQGCCKFVVLMAKRLQICSCEHKTATELHLQLQDHYRFAAAITRALQVCSCDYKTAANLRLQLQKRCKFIIAIAKPLQICLQSQNRCSFAAAIA